MVNKESTYMPETKQYKTMPYMPPENRLVYPEIYYKLQPYIMMVCDEMDTFGDVMPTQDMIDSMTDSVYEDAMRMYPELADYAKDDARQGQ
jgi:hypothetical protein